MSSLKISDGRSSFFQWDLNQKLIIENPSVCNKVHFTNSSRDMALVAEIETDEHGVTFAKVPNSLLTVPLSLEAYLYQDDGDCKTTVSKYVFGVVKRDKPENYVYTEDEHKDFDELLSEMENNLELTKQYRDEAMSTDIGTVRIELDEYTDKTDDISERIGAIDFRETAPQKITPYLDASATVDEMELEPSEVKTLTLDMDRETSDLLVITASVDTEPNDAIALTLEPDVPTADSHNFGVRGQICMDSNYLYVCVSDHEWKKISLLDL